MSCSSRGMTGSRCGDGGEEDCLEVNYGSIRLSDGIQARDSISMVKSDSYRVRPPAVIYETKFLARRGAKFRRGGYMHNPAEEKVDKK